MSKTLEELEQEMEAATDAWDAAEIVHITADPEAAEAAFDNVMAAWDTWKAACKAYFNKLKETEDEP